MNTEYLSIIPAETPLPKMHNYLLSVIGPRPIAFVSTIDRTGKPNLAPFSYFNVFSTRPPLLIFSPNRSGQTGKNKDTVTNILDTFEAVVNVVSYSIVQQMNLASAELEHGINEFEKSGLTPIPSDLVKPFRVKESLAQLECKVKEVIVLGGEGGSGNLVLCEVLKLHLHPAIFDENQKIDPNRLDLVARMGGNWYCRAQGANLFELPKPANNLVFWDQLPQNIAKSKILTGNELGRLAHHTQIPSLSSAQERCQQIGLDFNNLSEELLHKTLQTYIQENDLETAWSIVVAIESKK